MSFHLLTIAHFTMCEMRVLLLMYISVYTLIEQASFRTQWPNNDYSFNIINYMKCMNKYLQRYPWGVMNMTCNFDEHLNSPGSNCSFSEGKQLVVNSGSYAGPVANYICLAVTVVFYIVTVGYFFFYGGATIPFKSGKYIEFTYILRGKLWFRRTCWFSLLVLWANFVAGAVVAITIDPAVTSIFVVHFVLFFQLSETLLRLVPPHLPIDALRHFMDRQPWYHFFFTNNFRVGIATSLHEQGNGMSWDKMWKQHAAVTLPGDVCKYNKQSDVSESDSTVFNHAPLQTRLLDNDI
eukprot:m.32773 g.32773  ORF g.32773 m.32773 type:complete len:294 (-) comp8450_c0_seq1:309-1190(-)